MADIRWTCQSCGAKDTSGGGDLPMTWDRTPSGVTCPACWKRAAAAPELSANRHLDGMLYDPAQMLVTAIVDQDGIPAATQPEGGGELEPGKGKVHVLGPAGSGTFVSVATIEWRNESDRPIPGGKLWYLQMFQDRWEIAAEDC